MGIAGVLLGLLAGWIIGSQQAAPARTEAAAPAAQSAPPGQQAQPLDESRAASLKQTADSNPKDPVPRTQLGNMYFDAGRFEEAAKWYVAALDINPRDADVSTDL